MLHVIVIGGRTYEFVKLNMIFWTYLEGENLKPTLMCHTRWRATENVFKLLEVWK